MKFKTVIEPFRIKVVEPIKRLSRKERQLALEKAQFNLFKLKSEDVLIDLLTDSGTSAMSSDQWAELMRGDESYAGSRSFYALKTAVQNQMNYKHIFPVHQGRAAERILFQIVGGEGKVIPNNTHFDTTRANCEYSGAKAIDLCDDRDEIFKGNMDLAALKKVLSTEDVPLVMMTITNNSRGGHPVSMENMEKAYELAKSFGVPVFLDCARFAENAYWIKKHEKGFSEKSVFEIAREMFSYSDGCTMSAKKDAFANMGGLLCCNEDALSEKIQNLEILTEGFPTYGGLSGRDLACLAQGLKEIVDEDYLEYRYASAHYFARKLRELGVPVLEPVGLHALYVDAGKMLSHIPSHELPAQALCNALYIEGGIRSVEIGTLMFGEHATKELVRLAIPRRVYTQSHVDYMVEVFSYIQTIKMELKGYKILREPPFLRHFSADLAQIEV